MEKLHTHLIAKTQGSALKENIITVGSTRISVLLDRVLRIEFDKSGSFTDMPTQSIWFRDHGKVHFTASTSGKHTVITTEKAEFMINTENGKLVWVKIDGKCVRPNPKHNLKGTARTLDGTIGKIQLKDGVLSADGVALFDDSKSLLLGAGGMVEAREHKERDLYVFAFGKDYIGAVQALYALSGEVPLVPRFALGNWWSRYYPYSQTEYQNLMLQFQQKDIPFTVATVDMDWHWVHLEERFGGNFSKHWAGITGWTGYSWNTDLFPDPQGFLQFLHKQGLKTTLNLHPADGFRWFEDCYNEMADAMGVDKAKKELVKFDIADTEFINNYLDIGHHKHESDGVDFWWIDWQQGTKSGLRGLDPLWSLNHYHYYDNGRDMHRPLILSRYAGIGSHRYPLGFSGDTAMNWKVIDFQPYFTATASNCGYTWWSHDIGGHHFGKHDDELYTRWVQYGVFSPILRLHSTQNDLFGKEPWNFSWTAEVLATEALRLRHRLIPYIYSMNYRNHHAGRALCEPLYYTNPDVADAYQNKNGYFFGSELLVCPVTSPCDKRTKRAETAVYLPNGRWTNFFTGEIYKGGKTVCVHSDLNAIPVFAKAGAIVPMSGDKGNSTQNPEHLTVRLYRGNGSFTLYEDDGETNAYKDGAYSLTEMRLTEVDDTLAFTLSGAKAESFMPAARTYTLYFADVLSADKVTVAVKGKAVEVSADSTPENGTKITLPSVPVDATVTVTLHGIQVRQNPPYMERIRNIMTHLNGTNIKKSRTYLRMKKQTTQDGAVAVAKRVTNRALRAWLLEALCDME